MLFSLLHSVLLLWQLAIEWKQSHAVLSVTYFIYKQPLRASITLCNSPFTPRHTTANLLYTDTLNFLLKSVQDGKSTLVTGFSISQLAGSYGDEGQNYYNLVSLMDSVSWSNQYRLKHADDSCPSPN
jgi:hypothetical protein